MRFLFLFLSGFLFLQGFSQSDRPGIITGSVLDEKSKPLEGATVQLFLIPDSNALRSQQADATGQFTFQQVGFGYYRLRISFSGFQTITLDSIYLRAERFDFNLNDLVMKPSSSSNMQEVIVYAEKPLIQSKDGNITYNAGESALSAGSNASDLLTNVPLVSKDPTGKIMVRGKEPKVLIDDKPVELNMQQLQDLLESMPGSSIEKIEVLTNPPPQYANEQGGVINIVTKKGTVGRTGRLSVSGGTRGEASISGNYNYRKEGVIFNITAGTGYNEYGGEGYSARQNIYTDSSSYFNTNSSYTNKSMRPNLRANFTYDINKFHSLNFVAQYNGNDFDNSSHTQYRNLNRNKELYRLRDRDILSSGNNYNPNFSLSYTAKTKKPGEVVRIIANMNWNVSKNNRDFYERFLNGDGTPSGADSTQQQITDNKSKGYTLRGSYDVPLNNNKTYVSLGGFYSYNSSDVNAEAYYKRKADGKWTDLEALNNHFVFYQQIRNMRASVKQVFAPEFSVTAGLNAEQTEIHFDLLKTGEDTTNSYWSILPFATLNKNWKDVLNLTFSYRKTVRRPGIGELNPTIDFSDPYNIRFGNPGLKPSIAHNFDLVIGRTRPKFFVNLGLGYNEVLDIYNAIRTRINNDTTQTTWQNISGRKEYEISTWSGITLSKRLRVNLSAGYTYNVYGDYDREVRKFRNGGSFTSGLNGNYTWLELYTVTGNFTFNRFANPQGTVSSTLSMNLGFQVKLMQKKLIATLNVIDPFVQQTNKTITYGTNFVVKNGNTTQTRNFRLSLGYNFSKSPKKTINKDQLKNLLPKK